MIRDAGNIISGSTLSEQNASIESRRVNYRPMTQTVACNTPAAAAAAAVSHLDNIMTSPSSSSSQGPRIDVYTETLAWLRQLHAMCSSAAADAPFPLPFPPMTSPEAAYYVTKMAAAAPMQPFDPGWASCPSPSTAPCVDPAEVREGPRCVAGRAGWRDFSIPSILRRGGGPSSTGADSDGTSETDERCHSTSSSLDDVCSSDRHHLVTLQRNAVTSHVEPMSHQRRRQQFECPQCNKVRRCKQSTYT